MITLKQLKEGAKLPDPIYKNVPYILTNNKVVLDAGSLEHIKSSFSYYDECIVDIRRHDFYTYSPLSSLNEKL